MSNQLLKEKIVFWSRKIRQWTTKKLAASSIFPGEMAAFLAMCDVAGVKSIVESGRGDGAYSTQILSLFAEEKGIKIASIDFDSATNKTFNDELAKYKNLTCISGNAFDVFPEAMNGQKKPVALLIDGPKGESANFLSLAASYLYDVRVVSHHNCPPSSYWGKGFKKIFPSAFHYESLELDKIDEWREFKKWEKGVTTILIPERSLEASSLVLTFVDENNKKRNRFRMLTRPFLKTNPLRLFLKWKEKLQQTNYA